MFGGERVILVHRSLFVLFFFCFFLSCIHYSIMQCNGKANGLVVGHHIVGQNLHRIYIYIFNFM